MRSSSCPKYGTGWIRRDERLHAVLNYKDSHPLVITLRISRYPSRTLGECIKKRRIEQGLFQVDLAKMVGVNEMTIVNWEKGRTKPAKKKLQRLEKVLDDSKSPLQSLKRVEEWMEGDTIESKPPVSQVKFFLIAFKAANHEKIVS
jgi:transcriptional regulator with XRE-family HTH domain